MSDEAPEKSGNVWFSIAATFVLVPVAYVLMAGPVVVLLKRRMVPEEPVFLVYGPFDRALHRTPFLPAWESYLNAWLSASGTPK